MSIDSRAAVDRTAELADDVEVGPFAVIGPRVSVDSGTRIASHAVVHGPTHIGRDNHIHAHAAVGGDPQDKKFRGEETRLEIGDGNTIREFVTLNRGTGAGGGVTRLGGDNWIMAYVHIAHDCLIGDHTIFANCATLAGHVEVDDYVVLGGFSLVHQFCRLGAHCFTAMAAGITRDVPPFVTVAGHSAVPRGINTPGLKRRGFDPERLRTIRRAYKILYRSGLRLEEATAQLDEQARASRDVATLLAFIQGGTRGILR